MDDVLRIRLRKYDKISVMVSWLIN